MPEEATLVYKNQKITLPLCSPTLGNDVVQINQLAAQKIYTLDPGFNATASCTSTITFIDGDKGILLYRGYPIDALAESQDYMSVCYLLIHGELPTAAERKDFIQAIHKHSLVDGSIKNIFDNFPQDAHPMGMLLSTVTALFMTQQDPLQATHTDNNILAATRLIASMSVLAAMCYRHTIHQDVIPYRADMSYAENFLNMMFSSSKQTGTPPDPTLVEAMDRIFILHADHEQNASTTAVRVAGSTGANPFACMAAGIAALWGPAHGGANEACLEMLKTIGHEKHIPEYLKKAKDKNDPFRLMGFGHRVYKNYDPRAKIMRATCHRVLDAVGRHDEPLFKLALQLEKIALEDSYFVERKLYPNVDFYSGITLNAMGIPSNMFTVIFALARTVGWMSHWIEMVNDPAHRLARPRQLYQGHTTRQVPTS